MPKLISLYTGAGGLDLGFEAAGFTTAAAVEMDPEAVATLRANRSWPVIDRDIHAVQSDEILATAGLQQGDSAVLIGGPPCQPFSKSGYWASGDTLRLDDPRAGTLAAYLRVLRDTLPKAFLLENVPGLAFNKKSEGIDLIERVVGRINREQGTAYQVEVAKLNAADYGVPQLRERVFVVGARDGSSFTFPRPTHASDPTAAQPLSPRVTSWDALGADSEADKLSELRLRGKWAALLPTIPEGGNYLWHTDRGGGLPLFGWRRRYWSFLLKLAKSSPAWTIQAQPGPAIGPFHWKNRRLSARELCRLQTFPEGYAIVGNLQSAQRQVGNAVPSAMAEVMARAIRKQLLGDKKISSNPTLIQAYRRPIPPPEAVEAVPQEYRHLIGNHEAHPGTGQGYSAQQRAGGSDQIPPLAFAARPL